MDHKQELVFYLNRKLPTSQISLKVDALTYE